MLGCPLPELRGMPGAVCRSSPTSQAACFSTLNNSPRSPARCDALGRRAREAVPDSRAAVSGAQGPKARKAPANKGGVIWWSTDAEERKRRQKSRRLGRL